MSVLFHDAFFDHMLEIFWCEKCAVLLNWRCVILSITAQITCVFETLKRKYIKSDFALHRNHQLQMMTNWNLSNRYDLNLNQSLQHSSFESRILWSTVSKAFCRLTNTLPANSPLSRHFLIRSMMSIRAWTVEWPEQQRTQHGTQGDTMTNLSRVRIRVMSPRVPCWSSVVLDLYQWSSFGN